MKRVILAMSAIGFATSAWGQTGSTSSPTNVQVRVPSGPVRVPLGIEPAPTYPAPNPPGGGGGGWIPPGGGWWPRPRPPWVINYNPPIIVGYGPWGLSAWSPPLIVGTPGYVGAVPVPVPTPVPVPVPVPTQVEAPQVNLPRPIGVNRDLAKEKDLILRGDRFFKAGKVGQAIDRFKQAIKANPDSFQARLRLSEIAFDKGNYAEAASWLHEAVAADPRGLEKPTNVEAMFVEPEDFQKAIERLETHLQAKPEDRDAWMVLGVQHLLSGHPDRASDAFLRLDPDRDDPTLRALMLAAATKLKF